jgi:SAM-dependent methyltransferase
MTPDHRSVLARVLASDVRAAERRHVQLMESTEGLPARPFLGGTSLDVDRALTEIAVFSAMARCLPRGPGSLVLDLGAGPCWVSDWLQRLRYRTLSLDLAEDMLAIGRRRLAPGSWVCAGDMAALPVRAGTVDAALCYGALHHVPEWPRVLGEVHRALKDGGVLVLQEPGRGHAAQAQSIAQMEQFGVLEQDLPPRHLARACLRAGFSRVAVRPVALLAGGRSRILPPYALWRAAPRVFLHKRIQRLLATVTERLLNLVSPMHIVVAAKGTPWADSRRPETLLARFREVDCPTPAVGVPAPSARPEHWATRRLRPPSHPGSVRCDSVCRPGRRGRPLAGLRACGGPSPTWHREEIRIEGEVPPPSPAGAGPLRSVAEGVAGSAIRTSIPCAGSRSSSRPEPPPRARRGGAALPPGGAEASAPDLRVHSHGADRACSARMHSSGVALDEVAGWAHDSQACRRMSAAFDTSDTRTHGDGWRTTSRG